MSWKAKYSVMKLECFSSGTKGEDNVIEGCQKAVPIYTLTNILKLGCLIHIQEMFRHNNTNFITNEYLSNDQI